MYDLSTEAVTRADGMSRMFVVVQKQLQYYLFNKIICLVLSDSLEKVRKGPIPHQLDIISHDARYREYLTDLCKCMRLLGSIVSLCQVGG